MWKSQHAEISLQLQNIISFQVFSYLEGWGWFVKLKYLCSFDSPREKELLFMLSWIIVLLQSLPYSLPNWVSLHSGDRGLTQNALVWSAWIYVGSVFFLTKLPSSIFYMNRIHTCNLWFVVKLALCLYIVV